MAVPEEVADRDTESDNERPSDQPTNGRKLKEKQPWQSLFSTANYDNGRLTLKISHVDEGHHHHHHHFRIPKHVPKHKPAPAIKTQTSTALEGIATPRLNVVIQIVGSRGDVQPYVALGKVLQKAPYNHRVRLATHPNFKDFVEENGLEFFSIDGDPEALMSYMIKNPGILPGKESRKAGDPSHRRADIGRILQGCWRSCIERGDGMKDGPGYEKDGTRKQPSTAKPKNNEPFLADAIIANPPSYAHIHCAEKLAVPLQLSFTMPWSPTQAFPHPLANITPTNESKTLTNYASFVITDTLTWQGLGDIFNNFRTKTLGLEPINPMWGATIIPRLRVPWTYCWSKALIPKPSDWDNHIAISGFYFLELASSYKPPEELQKFLDAGEPPVYIGFGSITISKPKETMEMILEAVKKTGVRALISKGWGGLQCDDPPPEVFMLDNCPHDWLFPRVSCVVHHGGAGTTAIGIKLGKPTVIIPFFGDQPFWGGMVYRAGAGPKPVPFRKLTADRLAECLETALKPESLEKAKLLGKKVENEDGAAIGARQFQDSLDIDSLRCSLLPDRVAVSRIKHTAYHLSSLAIGILFTAGALNRKDIEPVRHREWPTDQGPMSPVGGAIAAVVSNATNAGMGIHQFHKSVSQINKDHKEARKSMNIERTASDRSIDPRLSGDDIMDNYLGNIQDHLLDRESIASESSSLAGSTQIDQMSPRPSVDQLNNTVRSPKHTHFKQPTMASKLADKLPADSTIADRLRLHITRRGTFPIFRTPGRRSTLGSRTTDTSGQATNSGHLHAVAIEACRAANTIVSAGLNTPVELAYNLASGFHNAPILYFGDKTVRPLPRITGFKSGAKAAGSEFVLGFYDALTGLVTQPYTRTRDEGWMIGLPKGIATGIGGLVLKSSAAVFGVPGYLWKGSYNSFRRPAARNIDKQMLATRRMMSLEAMRTCSGETQALVLRRWEELVERDSKEAEERKEKTKHGLRCDHGEKSVPLKLLPKHHHLHRHMDLAAKLEGASEKELEEAVSEAVRLTTNGDDEEDKRIGDAVRASLLELQGKAKDGKGKGHGHKNGDVNKLSKNGTHETKQENGLEHGIKEEADENTADEHTDDEAGTHDIQRYLSKDPGVLGDGTHLLQYEVWRRICEAHMGITPQSQLGVSVTT